jgi:murein DD-endopeptidase MepM/ murein hydrolase activator NlpD
MLALTQTAVGALVLGAIVLGTAASDGPWVHAAEPEPVPMSQAVDAPRLPSGVVLPYPTTRVFRAFGACIGRGRHRHEAIDLGGVGPESGLGTPVRSMVRARIVLVGSGDERPKDFGAPDRRPGKALRGGRRLPRSRAIDGYGEVRFFTALRGKWRSGTIVATIGLEPPLEGHLIRYMHLAAIRPGLGVGDVVEAGAELGLLGGTGVQKAGPHVHIDVRTPDDRAVDVAPLLGLAPSASCGPVRDEAVDAALKYEAMDPPGPPAPIRWTTPDGVIDCPP